MSTMHTGSEQWIVCRLMEQSYAFPSINVQEMMAMPNVRSIPRTPASIRGIIDRRGSILPILDLRMRFGMPSFREGLNTFCTMLQKREQDHRNWLSELEASVAENREFRLTTNPHACAFGKWYDNYHPDDPWLAAALRKFDAPHQRIHAIGATVTDLVRQGNRAEATAAINEARNGDLAVMVLLFAELEEKVRETSVETLVVAVSRERVCGVAVDRVEAVEAFEVGATESIPVVAASSDPLVQALAKRARNQSLVTLLDVHSLLDEIGAVDCRAA